MSVPVKVYSVLNVYVSTPSFSVRLFACDESTIRILQVSSPFESEIFTDQVNVLMTENNDSKKELLNWVVEWFF